MLDMPTRAEWDAAWEDWSKRVASGYPDWNFYPPGAERPTVPWWRRMLKL